MGPQNGLIHSGSFLGLSVNQLFLTSPCVPGTIVGPSGVGAGSVSPGGQKAGRCFTVKFKISPSKSLERQAPLPEGFSERVVG